MLGQIKHDLFGATIMRVGVVATLMVGVFAMRADAQRSNKPDTVKVIVAGIGRVTATTGVVAGNRDNGGNLFASTTATSLNNGPYALQAKLTVPFTDKNKPQNVNTVQGLNPLTNSYVTLTTTTWSTVAIGTGGTGKLNTISLYIDWAKSSSKDPKQIPDIQLTYQVIPR